MLINIDVNRIIPHPNNPRQNLGDLTELADSIKSKGILQNLTIVPVDVELYLKKINMKKAYPGEYTVIIGHRRLAAAKLAGLAKVPCIIAADMDEKTQIATMLLENIQRNDLTVYEEAQGFQLLLDFGETFNSIAEKTGFSQSTIRQRVKLLDLDKDKFKESVARGATLQDYAQLNEIRDIELKNSVLEKVGTSNFKYELKCALDKEKQADKVKAFVAELEKFAAPAGNIEGLQQLEYFSHQGKLKVQKPDDTDTVKYYFSTSEYGTKLFRETTPEDIEADQEREKEKQKQQENKSRLDEISSRALQLRVDFIKECKNVKSHAKEIMMFAVQTMAKSGWGNFNHDKFLKMFDIKLDKTGEKSNELMTETVSRIIAASPERGLLIAAYCNYGDSSGWCYNWECEFKRDEKIINLYSFLEKLGYEMSDEERTFCNGTHEAYMYNDANNTAESTETTTLKAAS